MWLKQRTIIRIIVLCVFFLLTIEITPATNQYTVHKAVAIKNIPPVEHMGLKNSVMPQHSLLLTMIIRLLHFRFNRGQFLCDISITLGAFGWVTIDHPILFFRGFWLMISADFLLSVLEPAQNRILFMSTLHESRFGYPEKITGTFPI